MTLPLVFAAFTLTILTFFVAVVAARSVWMLRQVASIVPLVEPSKKSPTVAVIVSASGEGETIERCVRSLADQRYRAFELVVVDNEAAEDTVALLQSLEVENANVRVNTAQEPPPGWTRKTWALSSAARSTEGEWLLFTQGNCLHDPLSLASAVSYARRTGADMLSMYGLQESLSFWERVIQPVLYQLFSLANPIPQVNDPSKPRVALARGEFTLVKRRVYEAVGGHQALLRRVDEYLELARRVKIAGYRINVADGSSLLRTRTFTGFRGVWEGWRDDLFLATGGSRPLLTGAILIVLLFSVVPFALLLSGIVGALVVPGAPLWSMFGAIGLSQSLLVLGSRRKVDQMCEIPPWFGPTQPIGGLIVAAILLSAARGPRRASVVQA